MEKNPCTGLLLRLYFRKYKVVYPLLHLNHPLPKIVRDSTSITKNKVPINGYLEIVLQ